MPDNDDPRLAPIGLAIAILVIGSLVVATLAIPKFYEPPSSAGEFGDMFGGVNALFSGLAFLGVIIAILLQKRELALQRKELEQTREELAGQKQQLALQNATFRQQAFDSTFFQMLSLHHQIVNEIDLRTGDKDIRGRDCFVKFYEDFTYRFYHGKEPKYEERTKELVCAEYMENYEYIQADVGHYFRNLYNIVKFVGRSDVQDKKFYTNLIRAQLSSHELALLFYNCATSLGKEKFKPLVERYALLKNLPDGLLIEQAHRGWYADQAYE
jgi:putative phage abortive infection protein